MQKDTGDKTMAVYCAEKLRAKGVFAEVISRHEGRFDATHEVWIKESDKQQFQVDLDAAFAGSVVKLNG